MHIGIWISWLSIGFRFPPWEPMLYRVLIGVIARGTPTARVRVHQLCTFYDCILREYSRIMHLCPGHSMVLMKQLLSMILLLTFTVSASGKDMNPQAYGLLKSIYAYDQTYPLNVRTVGSIRHGETVFEKIVFDSFHDGKVPGLLALPTTGEAPFPVVLLLHGVTGSKEQWLADSFTHGGEVSARLLGEGFAVLALDAQYHGDRAVYNDYLDVGEMVFKKGWGIRYANMLTQSVVDYRRAIDYLATRDDIDSSRVGLLGYSMGGHMAFILGAVEKRIRATVACVVPHTAGMPMSAAAFARDMGTDPLLMLMAKKDRFYTQDQANALFDAVPGNAKTLQFFDSGHSLPVEYTTQATAWFRENL